MDLRLDGVEIKVTIGADRLRAAGKAFGLSDDDGGRRRIYFCEDTAAADGPADLPLLDHGVILRLREIKGGADDSTVKLRPFDQARLTPRWRHAGKEDRWELKVEGDWVGDRHVVSASLTADQDQVRDVGRGRKPLGAVIAAEQELFLQDCAPVAVRLEQLEVLGPVEAIRWKDVPVGDFKAVAERWDVDDELRFLELSILADPQRAAEAQRRFLRLVAAEGFGADQKQETKTRLVLERLAGARR